MLDEGLYLLFWVRVSWERGVVVGSGWLQLRVIVEIGRGAEFDIAVEIHHIPPACLSQIFAPGRVGLPSIACGPLPLVLVVEMTHRGEHP